MKTEGRYYILDTESTWKFKRAMYVSKNKDGSVTDNIQNAYPYILKSSAKRAAKKIFRKDTQYYIEYKPSVSEKTKDKIDKLVDWLTDYKVKNNVKGVVLGLSGGKDSTVVAMLAKKVWGDNVEAVLMPNGEQKDINDSLDIAQKLNLSYRIVNIANAFNSIIHQSTAFMASNANNCFTEISSKSKTNIAPRIRMTVLYGIAQTLNYLVIGTGNRSEAYIGWTTKWGDSACDFNPIGHLTCGEVIEIGKELAKEFKLPEKYIVKTPADGLTNKSDEDNLGFTYAELDNYLLNNVEGPNIEKIKQMHKWSEHKRHMPTCVKVFKDTTDGE